MEHTNGAAVFQWRTATTVIADFGGGKPCGAVTELSDDND